MGVWGWLGSMEDRGPVRGPPVRGPPVRGPPGAPDDEASIGWGPEEELA